MKRSPRLGYELRPERFGIGARVREVARLSLYKKHSQKTKNRNQEAIHKFKKGRELKEIGMAIFMYGGLTDAPRGYESNNACGRMGFGLHWIDAGIRARILQSKSGRITFSPIKSGLPSCPSLSHAPLLLIPNYNQAVFQRHGAMPSLEQHAMRLVCVALWRVRAIPQLRHL
ncbi:unnamed protein product, partial [Nesidiocoris tenuis]